MYVLRKTDPLTGLGGKVSQRPATLGQCARQSCLQTTPPWPGINRYDGTTTPFSVSFATTLTVGYGSPIAGRLQNRENKKKRDGRILRIFSGSKPLGKAIKYNKIEAGEPPGAASRPPSRHQPGVVLNCGCIRAGTVSLAWARRFTFSPTKQTSSAN